MRNFFRSSESTLVHTCQSLSHLHGTNPMSTCRSLTKGLTTGRCTDTSQADVGANHLLSQNTCMHSLYRSSKVRCGFVWEQPEGVVDLLTALTSSLQSFFFFLARFSRALRAVTETDLFSPVVSVRHKRSRIAVIGCLNQFAAFAVDQSFQTMHAVPPPPPPPPEPS